MKKIKVIFITIISICIFINAIVYADSEQNNKIEMALSSFQDGDTIIVNVDLTDVDAGNGVDTITGALDYDKEVFEEISTSNFKSDTGWAPTFSTKTNKLTFINSVKTTSAQNVVTIEFKLRKDAKADETTITLKEIVASGGRVIDGGTGDIEAQEQSTTLNIDLIENNNINESLAKKQNIKIGIVLGTIGLVAILCIILLRKIKKTSN